MTDHDKTTQERERFEAWVKATRTITSLERYGKLADGNYVKWPVELGWQSWQARAELDTSAAPEWRPVLRDLLDYTERNECTHEETHRGGVLWTICDCCGRKWADDEGGFTPYVEPPQISAARELLAVAPLPPASGGAEPLEDRADGLLSVDELAQAIRMVDGQHNLGAGALAEKLLPLIYAAPQPPDHGNAALDIGVIPNGWKLVPVKPVDAWVHSYANWWRRQWSEPRCESPSEYDISVAREYIKGVLDAAPQPPASAVTQEQNGYSTHVGYSRENDTWFVRVYGCKTEEDARRLKERLASVATQPPAPARAGKVEPVAVSVKPLEWDPYRARTPMCDYRVSDEPYHGLTGNRYFGAFFGAKLIAECTSIQDAKAAAQADYERRVLSCITTAPAQPDDFERGTEAMRGVISARLAALQEPCRNEYRMQAFEDALNAISTIPLPKKEA